MMEVTLTGETDTLQPLAAGTATTATVAVRAPVAASRLAAYCLPVPGQSESAAETRELDHLLAVHFEWWDVLVEKKRPVAEGNLF